MRFRHGLAPALATVMTLTTLGACAPVVDVTPINPAPRCIMSREPSTVKVFMSRPENSVAVFGLSATNGDTPELRAALHTKAAHLGCDGILITGELRPGVVRSEVMTGGLNDRTEPGVSQLSAICLVMKAEASCALGQNFRTNKGSRTSTP